MPLRVIRNGKLGLRKPSLDIRDVLQRYLFGVALNLISGAQTFLLRRAETERGKAPGASRGPVVLLHSPAKLKFIRGGR